AGDEIMARRPRPGRKIRPKRNLGCGGAIAGTSRKIRHAVSNAAGVVRRVGMNSDESGGISMRYFMSIVPPADLRPEDIPQGLMDAMGPWMEKRLGDGALVSTGGLEPASQG